MEIVLKKSPPLNVTIPNGRVFRVPSPTRDKINRCGLWQFKSLSEFDPNEAATVRQGMLEILTEGAVEIEDAGECQAQFPGSDLDAVGEIELLNALVAVAYGFSPAIAVANQRALISEAMRKFVAATATQQDQAQ